MNNKFKLKVFKTNRTLNTEEQDFYRSKLKSLNNQESIISVCLEENNLYVEINRVSFNTDNLNNFLQKIDFPLLEKKELV